MFRSSVPADIPAQQGGSGGTVAVYKQCRQKLYDKASAISGVLQLGSAAHSLFLLENSEKSCHLGTPSSILFVCAAGRHPIKKTSGRTYSTVLPPNRGKERPVAARNPFLSELQGKKLGQQRKVILIQADTAQGLLLTPSPCASRQFKNRDSRKNHPAPFSGAQCPALAFTLS